MQKKTKIVCTIGPATESQEKLEQLLKAGMNVMRMNFSHGDFAEHQKKVDNLKMAMKKTGIGAAIMQDLSGPKFRIGDFYKERVELKAGDMIILTEDKIVGDEKRVSINIPGLHKNLKPGMFVMVDDGKKKFEIVAIKGKEIHCKIILGGETKGRRGVNLPGADLNISSLTEKDKADLAFGLKNKVDYVAFSFVRRASDVQELRDILNKNKSDAKIIVKMETLEAIEPTRMREIISLTDAVMVGRGDLCVEIGEENLIIAQKKMIDMCRELGKTVITATQILESMIKNPVPTRAEVSDITNAIFDGTDAIMLSEETTLGQFPVEAVSMMTKIASKVESEEYLLEEHSTLFVPHEDATAHDWICFNAVALANECGAKAIVALTDQGSTARSIARCRPSMTVYALTNKQRTANQLEMAYACKPSVVTKFKTDKEFFTEALKIVKSDMKVSKGDVVVVVYGNPLGKLDELANTVTVLKV